MERLGEITRVDGKYLEITICRPADCEKCHACVGGSRTRLLRLEGTGQVGDSAVVEMPESSVIKASAAAYVLPLVLLILGAFLGSLIPAADATLPTAIGGLVGLVLGALTLLVTEKIVANNPAWQPRLTRVIPAAAFADPKPTAQKG